MLSRNNEINVFDSYIGLYDFNKRGSLVFNKNDCFEYLICDKNFQLSIDLKTGKKNKGPKFTNSDNISALFFGEIFNFEELIKKLNWEDGDKETLSFSNLCCLLYKKLGVHFAKHINGMFSMVLRDKRENLLLLIVDRFGSARPIYYTINKGLLFSSHLKKIIFHDDVNTDINEKSLALFLKYSYIPSPNTIIKGVKKLNPGEMLICKGENFRLERYINFEVNKQKISEEEAVYTYKRLLSDSISKRFQRQKKQNVGLFLSGGLDSSANVALASEVNECAFDTFGVGFENPKMDERPWARKVANHFNVPFHDYVFNGDEIEDLPKMLWHLEEPYMENGLLLTYAGFKSINNRADILLSGNCADQLFGTGGFAGGKPIALRLLMERLHILSVCKQAKRMTNLPMFYEDNNLFKLSVLLRRVTDFNDWFFWGFDFHELKKLCKFNITPKDFDIFPNNMNDIPKNLEEYYQHSIVHQDIEHYACQNVLVKSSCIAEMFGVYARDPYLDYDVVDFILSLDIKLKRNGSIFDYLKSTSQTKYLHRLAMKNILPESILNKPKQGGFVNMALCLNNQIKRKLIFEYLLRSDSLHDYVNVEYIKNLLAEYEVLTSKKIYWIDHRDALAGKIMCLLTISIWFDVFKKKWKNKTPNFTLTDFIT